MTYILYAIGLIGPFFLIKYRERVGDMIGEAEWMKKVGGVYSFLIILAFFVFFWTLAEITGTIDIIFGPIINIIPGLHQNAATPAPDF